MRKKIIAGAVIAMTSLASVSTIVASATQENVQVTKSNTPQKALYVRGIPVLELEDTLKKELPLNARDKEKVHTIVEQIKAHLESRKYDEVQQDYILLEKVISKYTTNNDNTNSTPNNLDLIKDIEKQIKEIKDNLKQQLVYHAEQEKRLKDDLGNIDKQIEAENKNFQDQLAILKQLRDENIKSIKENKKQLNSELVSLEKIRQEMVKDNNILLEELKKQKAHLEEGGQEPVQPVEPEQPPVVPEQPPIQPPVQPEEPSKPPVVPEQPHQPNQDVKPKSLDYIMTSLTKTELKKDLKIMAEKSYIAPKDIDSYLFYFDKMKSAIKSNNDQEAKRNAILIKEIIDYYLGV